MRILGACGLLFLMAACGSPARPTPTPQQPAPTVTPTETPAVSPLAGSWLGSAQVLTCAGPACSPWVTQPEPPRPFSLAVIEEGASITALLDIDVRVHLTVELSGVRQPDGSVRFSGSSRPPPSLASRTADVNAFEIRADPASGLSGTFNYTVLWKTGSSTITGRIVSATRTLLSPTENCDGRSTGGRGCFDGTWEGTFVVRTLDQCADGCGTVQGGSYMRLNLTLLESDGVLSGTALVGFGVPVTGPATRASALLEGRRPTVSCGYPGFDVTIVCSEVIEDLTISLDPFGRMSGTLRYAREGWNGSSSGSHHYGFAVTGDLWNVVRTR